MLSCMTMNVVVVVIHLSCSCSGYPPCTGIKEAAHPFEGGLGWIVRTRG